jgi:hypothetical protein
VRRQASLFEPSTSGRRDNLSVFPIAAGNKGEIPVPSLSRLL